MNSESDLFDLTKNKLASGMIKYLKRKDNYAKEHRTTA